MSRFIIGAAAFTAGAALGAWASFSWIVGVLARDMEHQ